MKRFVLILIFIAGIGPLAAQQTIEKGFELLEKGFFAQAQEFFDHYLEIQPDNKAAQICYGRAMGLNGKAEQAVLYFAKLMESNVEDLEIRLNYSESLLWAKRYSEARSQYEEIVGEFPENFAAVLGYANTLSNLTEYEEALIWVDRATSLDPANSEAKRSRKYIRLGLAHSLVSRQRYQEGKELLLTNLEEFPADREILLNLAQAHLAAKEVAQAKRYFEAMARSKNDSIVALLGISLSQHIEKEDKQALSTALKAREQLNSLRDSSLLCNIEERYVQALIWNKKLKNARKHIQVLESRHGEEGWIISLKASLGMYSGDAKSSLQAYDQILENDQSSFDGNLGKANALFAEDRMQESYIAALRTLEFYDNHKDAMALLDKLNKVHAPVVEEDASFTVDNGQNQAFGSRTLIRLPWSTKFKSSLSYQFRTAENEILGNKAESHIILLGMGYKILPKTSATLVFGMNRSLFADSGYTQPVIDFRLNMKPLQLQHLGLFYRREVENFNADLISRQIVKNELGLNYHQSSNIDLGWYTQFNYTFQSDENEKTQLFTSLYYSFKSKPGLKFGFNYQYLSFKDQLPVIYFSPELFQAVELFADSRFSISDKSVLQINAAYGRQKFENEGHTPSFRTSLTFAQEISKRLIVEAYGRYNNIASATSAGFEFTEAGFRLKWQLRDKPVFRPPTATN